MARQQSNLKQMNSENGNSDIETFAVSEIEAYDLAAIQQEERNKCQLAHYVETLPVFQTIYPTDSFEIGNTISTHCRQINNFTASSLSYGEISYFEFREIFLHLHEYGLLDNNGGRFVDIGCGTGKIVFAALLLHDFHLCMGIEILVDLYQTLPIWHEVKCKCSKDKQATEIQFLNGDCTELDWMDGDVVFCHWTSFDESLRRCIENLAYKMRPGSFFISITHRIANVEIFECMETTTVRCSWGPAKVYVHRRTEAFAPGVLLNPRKYFDELVAKDFVP